MLCILKTKCLLFLIRGIVYVLFRLLQGAEESDKQKFCRTANSVSNFLVPAAKSYNALELHALHTGTRIHISG